MVDRVVEIQSTIYILDLCYKTRAKIFCTRYSTENWTERLKLQSFAKCQSLERRGVAQIPERPRRRLIQDDPPTNWHFKVQSTVQSFVQCSQCKAWSSKVRVWCLVTGAEWRQATFMRQVPRDCAQRSQCAQVHKCRIRNNLTLLYKYWCIQVKCLFHAMWLNAIVQI